MKRAVLMTLPAILAAAPALAGGLDRSGQGIDIIFEAGNRVELSFGNIMPSVTGNIGGVVDSGSVAPDYFATSVSIKTQINEALSFALIIDQPFGASVDYSGASAGYPVDAVAELTSTGITALVNYRIGDRISVHAGARMVSMQGELITGGSTIDFASDSGTGFVVGGAYEIPDIALRAALAYSSAIDLSHVTTAAGGLADLGATNYSLPQSINLDLQTGIAANTLLMASVRWVDWTETDINIGQTGDDLIDYTSDTITYTLGVGRRFSDVLSAAVSVSYEASTGEEQSNLSPTDGKFGITLGGTYTIGAADITAGVSYNWLGDAVAEITSADFNDNTALAVGIKIGYSF
ncbi:MAG: transporter [Rhodobacteraceae bacterium]|nr:transporter [Paracoccaceae bacterium]